MLRSVAARARTIALAARWSRRCSPLLPAPSAAAVAARPLVHRRLASSSSSSSPRAPPTTAEGAAPASSDGSRLASDSRGASLQFARWLSASGVRFNSLADGRPLFGLKRLPSNPNDWFLSAASSREIKKGESIFRLPLALTLSPASPLPDPLAKQQLDELLACIPRELWALQCGVRLLYEYGLMVSPPPHLSSSDSSFAAYINLLPRAFPTIPLFWNESQLQALQHAQLHTQVKLRSQFIRGLSAQMKDQSSVFGAECAAVTSPERLAWAMSCVSSRAFQLGASLGYRSLPLIDMMNHSYENNCKVALSQDASEVCVQAVRDIDAGAELSLNYGFQSNDSFLLNYGFLLDNNPADTLEVARSADGLTLGLELSGEEVPAGAGLDLGWKAEIAAKLGLSKGGGAGVAVPGPNAPAGFVLARDCVDPQLVAAVALMLAPADLEEGKRNVDFFLDGAGVKKKGSVLAANSGDAASPSQKWIATEQDLSLLSAPVVRVLFSYLSMLQSSFPTTLQQDVDALTALVQTMLTSEPDPVKAEQVQREELAVRFRIGKKRIISEQLLRLQRCM